MGRRCTGGSKWPRPDTGGGGKTWFDPFFLEQKSQIYLANCIWWKMKIWTSKYELSTCGRTPRAFNQGVPGLDLVICGTTSLKLTIPQTTYPLPITQLRQVPAAETHSTHWRDSVRDDFLGTRLVTYYCWLRIWAHAQCICGELSEGFSPPSDVVYTSGSLSCAETAELFPVRHWGYPNVCLEFFK